MNIFIKKYYNEQHNIRIITMILSVYFFLLPLDFFPVLPGTSILKIFAILPMMIILIKINEIRIRFNKLTILPILHLTILWISLFTTIDQNLSMQRILTIFLNTALLLLVTSIDYSNNEIEFIIKSMVFSGVLTIILLLFFSDKTSLGQGRVTITINGIRQDPNYLCGFFILPIMYHLSRSLEKIKIIDISAVIAYLVAVISTGSRGGLIAIIVSIFALILRKHKNMIKIVISLVFVVAIVAMIISFIPETVVERFSLDFTIEDGGANRFSIWKDIINNYSNFNIFKKLFGSGTATIRNFNHHNNVAHNIWIESLCETGFIGLIIIVGLYSVYYIKSIKLEEQFLSATLIGYIIMTFSMSLYAYKPIWNIFVIILIISNKQKNEKFKVL